MRGVIQRPTLEKVAAVSGIVALFILAALVASLYQDNLRELTYASGFSGVLFYIFITIIAVVVAPVSTLPLMPIATASWGWVLAGVYSIIGWTIGAQIAFLLARRYGVPIVKHFMSLEKIQAIEARVPKQNLFWSVVLLRMATPVDVLSYALGIFTRMSSFQYFLSTLIGVSPFAFAFAVVPELPFIYKIEVVSAIGIIVGILLYQKK